MNGPGATTDTRKGLQRRQEQRAPCVGSHRPAAERAGPDRGICAACGREWQTYTSNRRDGHLLVDHLQPASGIGG